MYNIHVKTLQGKILTFTKVSSYKHIDGMIEFKDHKTSAIKRFSPINCEIEEVHS